MTTENNHLELFHLEGHSVILTPSCFGFPICKTSVAASLSEVQNF